jgi:hypothetical protein
MFVPSGRYFAEGTCGAIISGSRQVKIEGSGMQSTVIDCRAIDRHFVVEGQSRLLLSKIQLTYGKMSGGQGGCIRASNQSQVILDDVFISNCEAQSGGALYAEQQTEVILMGNSVVRDCLSDEDGGCLYITGDGTALIAGTSELTSCRASRNSGAIHAFSSSVQFSDFAKATSCRATVSGGVATIAGTSGALVVGGQTQFVSNAAGKYLLSDACMHTYIHICIYVCIYIYMYI